MAGYRDERDEITDSRFEDVEASVSSRRSDWRWCCSAALKCDEGSKSQNSPAFSRSASGRVSNTRLDHQEDRACLGEQRSKCSKRTYQKTTRRCRGN